jgi:hypothetical protein
MAAEKAGRYKDLTAVPDLSAGDRDSLLDHAACRHELHFTVDEGYLNNIDRSGMSYLREAAFLKALPPFTSSTFPNQFIRTRACPCTHK